MTIMFLTLIDHVIRKEELTIKTSFCENVISQIFLLIRLNPFMKIFPARFTLMNFDDEFPAKESNANLIVIKSNFKELH